MSSPSPYSEHMDEESGAYGFILYDTWMRQKVVCCCGRSSLRRRYCLWILTIALLLAALFTTLAGMLIADVEGHHTIHANVAYPNDTLEYGIWWYGADNDGIKSTVRPNRYYRPDATRVIVYSHGWQPGKYRLRNLESFNYAANDPLTGVDTVTIKGWLADGWQVGLFYWTQLADEPEVTDAEAKIWSTQGPKKMRWRTKSGGFNETHEPTVSVGELFVQSVRAALSNHSVTLDEFRIAGHSLGNQVVCNGGHLLHQAVANGTLRADLAPKRIALLDPYYSNGAKDYLGGKSNAQRATEIITHLRDAYDVATEEYQTSALIDEPYGDANLPMQQITAFVERDPTYIAEVNLSPKHQAAPNLYFWSYNQSKVPLYSSNGAQLKNTGQGPRTSLAQTKANMRSPYRSVQYHGKHTPDPTDDTYIEWLRSVEAPFTTKNHPARLTSVLGITLAIILGANFFVQVLSQRVFFNSGIFGPLLFAAVAVLGILTSPFVTVRRVAVALLAFVWGVRLSYASISHSSMGPVSHHSVFGLRFFNVDVPSDSWAIVRFFHTFITEPFGVWLMTTPILALYQVPSNPTIMAGDIVAIIFATGALFLTIIADAQKISFLQSNTGVFMHGLYSWSRHPSLFGDFVFMWSLFGLCANGFVVGVGNYNFFSVAAPCYFSIWLLLWTLPEKEDHLARFRLDNQNVAKWALSTSIFVPCPPSWFPATDAILNKLRRVFTFERSIWCATILVLVFFSLYLVYTDIKAKHER